MNLLKLFALVSSCVVAMRASPIVLVTTSDPGYYNNSIGTLLNSTNGGEAGPFPIGNDSPVDFPLAPNLSTASGALGNWLTNPFGLNANWQSLASIPNGWAIGTEVAVIYQFNTLGATNVVASFGVDNGIFAWLDGVYLGGARRPGGVSLGEHVFNVGDLDAGTHFLQLLLEDHGSTNGYAVQITADTFIPGEPNSVPETASFVVYVLGFGFLAVARLLFLARAQGSLLRTN